MMKNKFIAAMCVLLILILPGCSKKNEPVEKTATKMDTVIRLRAYGSKAETAIDAAMTRIDEIEQIASSSIDTSDVSKINKAAGKEYVKVHPEIIKMLTTAVKFSKLSNGAFDISVGPLIKLWGIGTDSARVPADDEIKSLMPLVGYNNISINESDNSVKLLKEGMSIDLGGIAKGFTADEIEKIFKKYDITSALINLGGSSMYTMGKKPDGSSWTIGIQNPRVERNQGNVGIIKLSDQSLSTSGDYERYFIKDGKRYHHILNPFTGYPTDNGVMSDSIVIDGSIPDHNMLADILTKTVFVSGIEKGFKIIDGLSGISCIAVTTDYKIYKSSNWKLQVDQLNSQFKMAD